MDSQIEEVQEQEQDSLKPRFLARNVTINGKKWICGTGNKDTRVMFVAPNVLEEEAKEEEDIGYGRTRPRTPRLTDCGHGVLFKRLALKEGIDLEDCWYTTIIKHLPDNKQHRTRPPKSLIDEAMPFLEKEIEKIQPEIIVAVGKIAFDSLVDFKAKEDDVYGGWFYNKKYNAKIYLMPHITQVVKPEKHERYILDFRSIKTMLDSSERAKKMPVNIHVIHNAEELKQLVYLFKLMDVKVLSVDCEWEGHQHVDGKLRSLQLAWNETDGAYIRFLDDKLNYVFDVSYAEAGEILGTWCNREDVKYIGHHVSADLMWMQHWLKLNWYKKAIFDSEFALQCCDESLDLGLDILALRYTDFGKYDWDLIWWRKQNPDKRGDGYGQVPDKILISYAVKDVLTVYRAWKPISTWLERQQLTTYYNEILNPFVTDVFTFFGLKGLPIDKAKMDKMRVMYQWAKRELEKDFKSMIAEEAHMLLAKAIATAIGIDIDLAETILQPIAESVAAGKIEAARTALQQQLGAAAWMKVLPAFEHYIIAPEFNIRSKPQMQRWLFDVKKYTPVKSTANKAEGMPAVDWEKVMAYPEEKQRLFTPASDKGTLEILAARYDDQVIRTLLELNAVGNICKAFLREAEVDDDGELVAEKGLHAWLATDSAIHLQHSCTETGNFLVPLLLETTTVKLFNCWDGGEKLFPISSEACSKKQERSTTIPEGSTIEANAIGNGSYPNK